MPDFLPRADSQLVQWMQTFAAGIAADHASLGISPAQSDQLTALYETFHAAYRRAIDPSTQSRVAVAAKNESRATLKRFARQLAMIARTRPGIAPEQLIALGVPPAKPTRTPVGKPKTAPLLALLHPRGGGVAVQLLQDAAAQSRGMPRHYAQATLFYFVGTAAPADPARWTLLQQTSRARVRVTMPRSAAPGETVHLTARWLNRRGQMGPPAKPISVISSAFFTTPPALRPAA